MGRRVRGKGEGEGEEADDRAEGGGEVVHCGGRGSRRARGGRWSLAQVGNGAQEQDTENSSRLTNKVVNPVPTPVNPDPEQRPMRPLHPAVRHAAPCEAREGEDDPREMARDDVVDERRGEAEARGEHEHDEREGEEEVLDWCQRGIEEGRTVPDAGDEDRDEVVGEGLHDAWAVGRELRGRRCVAES